MAAAVATHPHRCISKRWHVTDVKKLHWRWPGNHNGRSKFRNLGLFTFTRSQLTLRRRLRCWWQLPEIAQMARNLRQKTSLGWPGSIKIPQIRKCMPTRSSKTSQKTSFCCYERRRDWRHCALFFPAITHNDSHSKNNFSTILTPSKNRDIHIVEFFL